MEQPQMTQQSEYNHLAQSCEFQPGDQVLLLDPSPNCKFLVCCSVPYTVTGKVVPVNYHLQLPSKYNDTQLYHVNLFKKLIEPAPVSSLATCPESSPGCTLINKGEELFSPPNKTSPN